MKLEPIDLYNGVRHSAGNQLHRQGWNEGMIGRLLGHASTKYVREFYVGTDAELLREKLKDRGGIEGQA